MPVLFIGHGSPMNGILDNSFSNTWETIGTGLPRPSAIMVISAHWVTDGVRITDLASPPVIYDFTGFPKELYQVKYPAKGSPELVAESRALIPSIEPDHEWGLDHGAWTILRRMFPDASIPVVQLSLDYRKTPSRHFDLALELAALRTRGVLIVGSGNLVHNLRMLNWQNPEATFDWALSAREILKTTIDSGKYQPLFSYQNMGSAIQLAIPTPEHFLPVFYPLALKKNTDTLEWFNDTTTMGSVSMSSFIIRTGV